MKLIGKILALAGTLGVSALYSSSNNNSSPNLKKPYIDNNDYYMDVKQGKLKGKNGTNHIAFYGIPFAKPPIGNLRWKKPENPENWKDQGIEYLDATDQKSVKGCPQSRTANTPDIIDEDCLYLNVFMPLPENIEKSSMKSRPIMLWIHGGSYIHGSGAINMYDGGKLAGEYGVIVVSINYRLGSFGFLYQDEINQNNNNDLVGNQAIWDMLKSIDWVKENADSFYGDKNSITIFGESAGGQSVSTLLSLKENAPNNYYNSFQQAIAESPPLGLSYRNRTQSSVEADTLIDKLGCKVYKGKSILKKIDLDASWECAKSKSWEDIIIAQGKVRGIIDKDKISSLGEAWTPTIDDILLDLHPLDALAQGRSKDKKIMYGHNNGEGDIFVYSIGKDKPLGKKAYELLIKKFFNGLQKENLDADQVLKKFPSDCKLVDPGCSNRRLFAQVSSSYLFDCPIRLSMRNRTNNNNAAETFRYLFSQPYQMPGFPEYAKSACGKVACHSAELPFVFGSFESVGMVADQYEKNLSDKMMTYWTNFAATGDPNNFQSKLDVEHKLKNDENLENWEEYKYSENNGEYVINFYADNYTPKIGLTEIDEYCNFWDELDAYLEH